MNSGRSKTWKFIIVRTYLFWRLRFLLFISKKVKKPKSSIFISYCLSSGIDMRVSLVVNEICSKRFSHFFLSFLHHFTGYQVIFEDNRELAVHVFRSVIRLHKIFVVFLQENWFIIASRINLRWKNIINKTKLLVKWV